MQLVTHFFTASLKERKQDAKRQKEIVLSSTRLTAHNWQRVSQFPQSKKECANHQLASCQLTMYPKSLVMPIETPWVKSGLRIVMTSSLVFNTDLSI